MEEEDVKTWTMPMELASIYTHWLVPDGGEYSKNRPTAFRYKVYFVNDATTNSITYSVEL